MKLDMNKVLFNLAGLLIGGFAIGYVISDALSTRKPSACSARYDVATMFPVHNAKGELLSPIELQAMAGRHERGVLERVSIVPGAGAPAPAVLEVKLPKGTAAPRHGSLAHSESGIGLRWSPQEVQGATSACLSYSAFVPADFEFGEGGVLPGLYGGDFVDPADGRGTRPAFAARLAWRGTGAGDAVLYHPRNGENHLNDGRPTGMIAAGRFEMPRGRWMTVEQEIVLNTPARRNGTYRLWIDGALKLELGNIPWRDSADVGIEGVVGNIGFSNYDRPSASPADTMMRLSPFELRWM